MAPATTTETSTALEVDEVELIFEVADDELGASQLAVILEEIESDIMRIRLFATYHHQNIYLDPLWRTPKDRLIIRRLSLGSPLQMLLKLPQMSADARKTVLAFLKRLVFYDEEKSRRQAEAAEKWEDALAKRIQNIKAVVDLVKTEVPDDDQRRRLVEELLVSTSHIQEQPAKLRRLRIGKAHK